MGLFNLFGGKKKDETAKAAPPVASPVAVAPAPVKAVEPVVEAIRPAPTPAAAAPVIVASGTEQVKLRLKLSAAKRAGAHARAYEAAKGLADIQAKAGRRMAARMWREEAERILAHDGQRAG